MRSRPRRVRAAAAAGRGTVLAPTRPRSRPRSGSSAGDIGFDGFVAVALVGGRPVKFRSGALARRDRPARGRISARFAAAFGGEGRGRLSVLRRDGGDGPLISTRACSRLASASHEDPATGSAAAAFAGVLAARGELGRRRAHGPHRAGLRDGTAEPDRADADDRRRQARGGDHRRRRGRGDRGHDRGLTVACAARATTGG